MSIKKMCSFRLDLEVIQLLLDCSEASQLSQSQLIELSVRKVMLHTPKDQLEKEYYKMKFIGNLMT